jgi:hypothetical protein
MSRRSVLLGMLALVASGAPMAEILPANARDLQAYCARAGDDDRTRPIPASVVAAARRVFGSSADEPAALMRKSTVYRCMSGEIWLCNYGANLSCGKADASRTSTGAAAFCKQNPSAESVPMAATGHDTIYEWKCVGGQPQIVEQIQKLDPRGFISDNWKRLEQ